jgi:hypothetical protein
MQRLSHLTVFLACVLVGCTRRDIVPGVSDSAFVATMVELRRVNDLPDSAGKAAARRRILQQRGLTVEQMDRAARALANDPKRLADDFDAVTKRGLNTVNTKPAKDSSNRPARP